MSEVAAATTLPTPQLTRRERWQRFPSTWQMYAILLLVTAAGAFLRFWRIDNQSYWIDEYYTVNRINGSFTRLLESLSSQGFPPGWYALLRWWCLAIEYITGSGATAFGPVGTRSLTALLGTLTIPAMYLLARQFTDRKGALLVALFTAVNPFLIYYSRDIKMYPATWFFMTLNLGLFFKWQTSQRHITVFTLWVLSGAAMVLMHAMAWWIVVIQLLAVLTRPRLRPLNAPLFLFGLSLWALTPIYWFMNRTNWVTRVVEEGGDGGVGWNTQYTDMSWQTVGGLITSHLGGYLWPVLPPSNKINGWFGLGGDFNQNLDTRAWPWLADWQLYFAVFIFAVLTLGLFPWRGIRRSQERQLSATEGRWWWIAIWVVIPPTALALTWLPRDHPWFKLIFEQWLDVPSVPRVWEPRYLGIIAPALILWLAASVRRFPTWPLRTLLVFAIVAASTFSALSSHLIFRQPPWHKTIAAALPYYDRNAKQKIAVGTPAIRHPGTTDLFMYQTALDVRPGVNNEQPFLWNKWARGLYDTEYDNWLRQLRWDDEVEVVVLTDRLGDQSDPAHPISNDRALALLNRRGAQNRQWRLVYEEHYRWHYEWRFYIFHTWRTRIWVKDPPATTSAAATTITKP